MNILIVDAHGGGAGKQLVAAIREKFPQVTVTAVGTNTVATSAMLKAGAHLAVTGENAAVVNCRKADVIIGPLGIAIADSLGGEITPAMALAVAQSSARRILLPFNCCDTIVAGIPDVSLGGLIQSALQELEKIIH